MKPLSTIIREAVICAVIVLATVGLFALLFKWSVETVVVSAVVSGVVTFLRGVFP